MVFSANESSTNENVFAYESYLNENLSAFQLYLNRFVCADECFKRIG